MDWVPKSDPFIHPKLVDSFVPAVLPQANAPECQALQHHDAKPDLEHAILSDDAAWEKWISSAIPTSGPLHNGFCILFIPRAAGAQLQTGEDTSGFTELPITKARWEMVAEAFYLPGHFYKVASRRRLSVISVQRTCDISNHPEKLCMQTSATDPGDGLEYDFALAATHIETRRFTFAIMVGCSSKQISKVKKLVEGWEEGAKHPLMMLGLCAELHLQRVEELVRERSFEYKKLKEELDEELKKELDESRGTNQMIWWKNTIRRVLSIREKSIRVEEEIKTTKSQLSKACQSGVQTLLNQYKVAADGQTSPSPTVVDQTSPSPTAGSQKSPSSASSSQAPPSPKVGGQTSPSPAGPATDPNTPNKDEPIEVTNLFDERFQDILSRLDERAAECRIGVEVISYSTDTIRSEIARQEAETSAGNTRYGTAFALMAAVYLPTTAVATIFAMPIFGWTNDWRDWRYGPVIKSSGGGDSGDSGAADQSGQPVFSGYFWIWLACAFGLSVITFGFFYSCAYRGIHGRNRNNVTGAV